MNIQVKLSISLLATALIITLYMIFFVQWNFGRGFLDYVNNIEDKDVASLGDGLAQAWAEEGGWQFLERDNIRFSLIFAEAMSDNVFHKRVTERFHHKRNYYAKYPHGRLPDVPNLSLYRRVVVYDRAGHQVYGYRKEMKNKDELWPILYKSSVIGYLDHHPVKVLTGEQQNELMNEQKKATLLIGIAAFLITLGLSLPFARHMTEPLRRLSQATRQLIDGNFAVRLKPSSRDEIGQLTQDFNSLATSLEQNQRIQKQWLSDISHELRTPLSVLQGEIEAMQDGIRKADREGLDGLHREVLHLSHLVNDLYRLAQAEDGLFFDKTEMDLGLLIRESMAKHERAFHQKSIKMVDEIALDACFQVFGDPVRLAQVFDNIFANSLAYTDEKGLLCVGASCRKDHIELCIEDSAPSLSQQECERIFDRLYRVERSRNRNLGGAGIGLAVSKSIIQAHDGKIWAERSELGGIKITLILPQLS